MAVPVYLLFHSHWRILLNHSAAYETWGAGTAMSSQLKKLVSKTVPLCSYKLLYSNASWFGEGVAMHWWVIFRILIFSLIPLERKTQKPKDYLFGWLFV